MKIDYQKNNKILFLSVIIISILKLLLGTSSIGFALLILLFGILIFLPNKYAIYNCFVVLPFMSLFDDIGFKFTFNFCMILTLIKMLKEYKSFNKTGIVFLLIFILIEIFNAVIYYTNLDFAIITFFSLILSFMLLIVCTSKNNKVSFEKLFISLFYGIIISVFIALLKFYLTYGSLNFMNYRFMGMFRDPNYYSFFILLLIFSSFKICEIKGLKINIYFLVLLIVGLLSTSKMFLLVCGGGLALKLISNIVPKKRISKLTKRQFLISIIATIGIVGLLYIVYKLGIIELILNNYTKRLDVTDDFTTGRFDINLMYINSLIEFPNFLILGASNTYYNTVIVDALINNGSFVVSHHTAHNTYMDLLLSWGIIGAVAFILFVINCAKNYKSSINITKIKWNINKFILIAVILISFLSLSFLSGDCFSLIIFYLIVFLYKEEEKEE